MQRKTLISLFSLALLAATMLAPALQAQNRPDGGRGDREGGRQGRRGGFGRGFGGGFGGGGARILGLLRSGAVREELKVSKDQQELIEILGDELRESFPRFEGNYREATEEQRAEYGKQLEKWRNEQGTQANETLKTILDEGQNKRLHEIAIQTQGANALLDANVEKELKLSEEQVAALKKTRDDRRAEMFQAMQDARQGGGGGFDRDAIREKMESFRKETEAKMLAHLTDEQKTAFDAMQGAKFDMPEGGFGRGGRGGRGPGGGRPGSGRPQRPE